ncbi:MAG: DMT family transporter [Hyphomicrobiales bacterium]
MRLSPLEYAMGVAVPLTWGMGFVFAKGAIEHFPPIFLMSLRFIVTALALVWFVPVPRTQFKQIFVLTFISATIQYSLTFTGLKALDASVAILIVQLEVPFLVLLGAIFLKETVGWRKWIGMALAFVGVAFIAGTPKINIDWVAFLMVIGGAFTWAVGQALARKLHGVEGMSLTAWVAVFAAPQLLIMSLIFEDNQLQAVASANWTVWATVIYLGLVMTAFGYGIWYTLVRRHPLNLVGPFLLLLPVLSIIGAAIFLGEKLTFEIALGAAIVIAGIAIIIWEPRKSRH